MLPVIPILAMATLGLAAVGDAKVDPPGLVPVVRWPNGWALYRVVSQEGLEEAKVRSGTQGKKPIPWPRHFLERDSSETILVLLPPVLDASEGQVGVRIRIVASRERPQSPLVYQLKSVQIGCLEKLRGGTLIDPFVPKALRMALFYWLGISPKIEAGWEYESFLLRVPIVLPDKSVESRLGGHVRENLDVALQNLKEGTGSAYTIATWEAIDRTTNWVNHFESLLRGIHYPWSLNVVRSNRHGGHYWDFRGWFGLLAMLDVGHLWFVVYDHLGRALASSDNSPLDAILASGLFVLESDWPAWAARNGEPGEPFVDTDIFVLLDEGNPVLWPLDRFLDLWRQL